MHRPPLPYSSAHRCSRGIATATEGVREYLDTRVAYRVHVTFFRPSLPPERPRKKLVVKLVVPEYTTKNQSERVMYPILYLLFPIVGSPLNRAKSQRARPRKSKFDIFIYLSGFILSCSSAVVDLHFQQYKNGAQCILRMGMGNERRNSRTAL